MDQENISLQVQSEKTGNALTRVTPLSKYLALILFIAMPFIGGWIGYMAAPVEKIVDVEKVIGKENSTKLDLNNTTREWLATSNEVNITRSYSSHPSLEAYVEGPSVIEVGATWNGVVGMSPLSSKLSGGPEIENWGDGTGDGILGGNWSFDSNGKALINHTYTKPGTYVISININGQPGTGFEEGTVTLEKEVVVESNSISETVLPSPTVEKIYWNIEKSNAVVTAGNEYKKDEQAISIDVTFEDKSTKRYDLGTAYGCTGTTSAVVEDDRNVFGKINCYYALSGVGFVAYSQNGKFFVERGDESARDGSVQKTLLLEI